MRSQKITFRIKVKRNDARSMIHSRADETELHTDSLGSLATPLVLNLSEGLGLNSPQ